MSTHDKSKTGTLEAAPGAEASDPGAPPKAANPSTTEIESLQAKAAKADEHWERLLRTTADLENFRKRAARERQDAIKFANESLMTKLIPALDNFDMALAAAGGAADASIESLKTGVSMIHSQLKGALIEAGLEEIDAMNQVFDPNIHEAVAQEDSTEVPEGHVIRQLRKGYRLRERLIRPATVVVARKPSA